jgi:ubiquinone/menaquinone biosynthesis C-methylase UbiE
LVPDLISKLQSGIRMLDVGCGSGKIINKLATLFPHSHFTGMDLSDEAIATASSKAIVSELKNVELY